MSLLFRLGFVCLLALGAPVRAEDRAQFLLGEKYTFVKDPQGRPLTIHEGHDEKYVVETADGTRYKLRLKDPLPLYAEDVFSRVSRAVGFQDPIVYPVFLERGKDGLPTSDEAKRLPHNPQYAGLAGVHGGPFQATLQPLVKLDAFDPRSLGPVEKAELVGQVLLNSVLGNHDMQVGSNIALSQGRAVTLDATQAFKDFGRAQDLAGSLRNQLPLDLRMSEADAAVFTDTLNGLITRMETLDRAELKRLLEPYTFGMNGKQRFQGKAVVDYAGLLSANLDRARKAALSYTREAGLDAKQTAALALPVPSTANSLDVPSLRLAASDIPSTAGHTEKQLLEALYYQDFWKVRQAAMQKWAQELGVPDGATVPQVLAARSAAKPTPAPQPPSAARSTANPSAPLSPTPPPTVADAPVLGPPEHAPQAPTPSLSPALPQSPVDVASGSLDDGVIDILAREIVDRQVKVPEFVVIAEEAARRGLRIWTFGGTATGWAKYVRADIARERGEKSFYPEHFDYDYTRIYRSTQDIDLVVDGDAKKAKEFEAWLGERFPYFLGKKSAWEIRPLREKIAHKGALLGDFDFDNQHTDSNSVGMIELTKPPEGESRIRDLRHWNDPRPPFLRDIALGKVTPYLSDTHEKTSLYKSGKNPPIFFVIRALVKALQYDSEISPADEAKLQPFIDAFDPERAKKDPEILKFMDKHGVKLFHNAVDLDRAAKMLDRLGLRQKLQRLGDPKAENTFAWWMSKSPLPAKALGTSGRRAGDLGITQVAHETSDYIAFESITRAHSGDPNVFESRTGTAGEAAGAGRGFYTKMGREGARATGQTIRFEVHPNAREGADFYLDPRTLGPSGEVLPTSHVVFLNKKAIRVIPESLKMSFRQFFEFLSQGQQVDQNDKALLETFRRRVASEVATGRVSEEDLVHIENLLLAEMDKENPNTSLFHEWFGSPFGKQRPKVIERAAAEPSRLRHQLLVDGYFDSHPDYERFLGEMLASPDYRKLRGGLFYTSGHSFIDKFNNYARVYPRGDAEKRALNRVVDVALERIHSLPDPAQRLYLLSAEGPLLSFLYEMRERRRSGGEIDNQLDLHRRKVFSSVKPEELVELFLSHQPPVVSKERYGTIDPGDGAAQMLAVVYGMGRAGDYGHEAAAAMNELLREWIQRDPSMVKHLKEIFARDSLPGALDEISKHIDKVPTDKLYSFLRVLKYLEHQTMRDTPHEMHTNVLNAAAGDKDPVRRKIYFDEYFMREQTIFDAKHIGAYLSHADPDVRRVTGHRFAHDLGNGHYVEPEDNTLANIEAAFDRVADPKLRHQYYLELLGQLRGRRSHFDFRGTGSYYETWAGDRIAALRKEHGIAAPLVERIWSGPPLTTEVVAARSAAKAAAAARPPSTWQKIQAGCLRPFSRLADFFRE